MPERAARLPVVGVMGSGNEEHAGIAEPLGRALAEAGVHLLTGGGRGVMEAVSRGFSGVRPRPGLVIGICPGRIDGGAHRSPEGYPNRWVELAIRTHLPDSGTRGRGMTSRNSINVLSSDLVIALPGGAGTASEIDLALRYGTPVFALGRGFGDPPGVRALAGVKEVRDILRERFGSAAAVTGERPDGGTPEGSR